MPALSCLDCHATIAVKLAPYAAGTLVPLIVKCTGCGHLQRLAVIGGKVIEHELLPSLHPPVFPCKNLDPYLQEYLHEAYRAFEGGAYTGCAVSLRLTLDGFLHWCGFTQDKLADKWTAAKGQFAANPRLDYLRRFQPLVDLLKNIADFGAHHRQHPSLVDKSTAQGALLSMSGLLDHYEKHGRP